jgi:hypothetical protein
MKLGHSSENCKADLPPGVFVGKNGGLEVALSGRLTIQPGRGMTRKAATRDAKRPPAPIRPRPRTTHRRTVSPAPARRTTRASCHGHTGPPAEGDGDPAPRTSVVVGRIGPAVRAVTLPKLELALVEVMISGRAFGRAGPFMISKRDFHELCAAARRLEAGGQS